MLVRIKPFASRKGHKIRRYVYQSVVYDVKKGWYEVSDAVAAYLATVRNDAEDENSPLAFDVCTPEEATEIDEQERIPTEKAPAVAPISPIRSHAPTRADASKASAAIAAERTITTRDLAADDFDGSGLDSSDLAADVAQPSKAIPGAPKRKLGGSRS